MKKRRNVNRKCISLLAAAAMTASLLGGVVYPAAAAAVRIEKEAETTKYIPENITIEEPVALSEVELPESEYGKLSWVDEEFVPDKRVQVCEVYFEPVKSVDVSFLPGWDEEKKVLKSEITVVVSSIEAEEDESVDAAGDDTAEEPIDEIAAGAADEEAVPEEGEEKLEEDAAADTGEDVTVSEEESASDIEVIPETDTEEEELQGTETDAPDSKEVSGVGFEKNDAADAVTEAPAEEQPVDEALTEDTAAEEPSDEEPSEEVPSDNTSEGGNLTGTGKLNDVFGEGMPGGTILDGVEEEDKTIFDTPQGSVSSDERPDFAEDNLTEEEMEARAKENHTSQGISVSGIQLPWYVQFRVSSGENYEFKNEEKAIIFRSYEFVLWDLKNDTEYIIPDGQYISVTVPVKEGYQYSIEHLLDNGATETIIPSVNGTTMVFSTHSFSPFGIAGFRPIIGEEIADGAYGEGLTPTPTPVISVSGTPTPPLTPAPGTQNGAGGTKTDAPAADGNGSGDAGMNGSGGSGSNGSGSGGNGNEIGTDGSHNGNANGTVGGNGAGNGTDGTAGSGSAGKENEAGSNAAGNNGGSSSNGDNNSVNNNGNSESQNSGIVRTGDDTVILPFVILVLVAAGAIIFVIWKKKK